MHKINDVMPAEAMRQILPLAERAAREVSERWAVSANFRAKFVLEVWTRQERGRAKTEHPDPGQSVPEECRRPKRLRTVQDLSC
jgi:hypothetical protein